MRKTVLIFGISSFVGSNLAQILKDDYRVVGTYFKTPVDMPGVTCYPCDILKKDYVTSLVSRIKPDYTIYAIGMSSLTECKLMPKQADALNAVGAVNACTSSERYGAKFIFLSSCYVLGGEDQLFKEGDTPFPNTVYGTTLSSTEFFIQRSCLNYLILRCSPLYGRSYGPRHPNWFESIQSALAKHETIVADDSVITGFLDIVIIARILKAFLNTPVTNRLFQISSKDQMSRFDFARLVARTFRKDENLIQRVSGTFPIDRGNNKIGGGNVASQYFFRMDTFNAEDFLGVKMPSIDDSIQLTYKRLSTTV